MWREGTYTDQLPKLVSAPVVGSNEGTKKKPDPVLVGETTKVSISLDKINTSALLDTGSCISVVSESFYNNNLKSKPLLPLTDIIKVECADGQELDYLGYIEADLEVTQGLPRSSTHTCLFLVTPDTKFSESLPVIIGTNIINSLLIECKEKFGEQYLQRAELHNPWYLSFRMLHLREKELARNKNRVALVRCAEADKITLGPNETRDIVCHTDKELD